MGYFSNVNPDLLRLASLKARYILELGCGTGAFARAYLARNPSALYTGVELDPESAKIAQNVIPTLVLGDIETNEVQEALSQARPEGGFDLLVIGDVLEHLRDPWATMAFLTRLVAPDGQAQICIPNAAHWSMLLGQLQGDWTYRDAGLLDRTHLRFFTRATAAKMFEDAGWQINATLPRIFNRGTGEAVVNSFSQLKDWPDTVPALDAQTLRANLLPLQWVFSLSRAQEKKPIRVQAFGMQTEHDAMVEVRLSRPLEVLQTTSQLRAHLTRGGRFSQMPQGTDVAWFYRTHLGNPEWVKSFAAEGGLLLLDIDDHPRFLPNHPRDDFLTLRGVHAVTTSTPHLADVVRHWNPEVHVIENALLELPPPRALKSDEADQRLHIVFAALNRTADWTAQCHELAGYLQQNRSAFRATVLHDETIAQEIGDAIETRFVKMLKYKAYLELLQTADIVLMPLQDTAFNRAKSDLKLVESLASEAVPVVSPVVAALSDIPPAHMVIAEAAQDWPEALAHFAANPDALRTQGKAGRDYIAENRLLAGQIDQRMRLLEDLRARQPALEIARQARLEHWQKTRKI